MATFVSRRNGGLSGNVNDANVMGRRFPLDPALQRERIDALTFG